MSNFWLGTFPKASFIIQKQNTTTNFSGMAHIYCLLCVFARRRQWHPTPVLLPGKSHGRRILAGYIPRVARSAHDWSSGMAAGVSEQLLNLFSGILNDGYNAYYVRIRLWFLRHYNLNIGSCHLGEGNGTPLQYSWLENPMDCGAWWAAVHGIVKSRSRLSDFTFTFHFSLSCIGEGNGNPLQCSCLENPRDGGAWWAAVSGVAQSRIRLKWLNSSLKLAI